MSQTRVKRKVANWEAYTPPVEWTAVLECGHKWGEYDHLSDETKEAVEKAGNRVDCFECGREEDRIAALESELKELKSRRKRGSGE
jgi:hypothetical protein